MVWIRETKAGVAKTGIGVFHAMCFVAYVLFGVIGAIIFPELFFLGGCLVLEVVAEDGHIEPFHGLPRHHIKSAENERCAKNHNNVFVQEISDKRGQQKYNEDGEAAFGKGVQNKPQRNQRGSIQNVDVM